MPPFRRRRTHLQSGKKRLQFVKRSHDMDSAYNAPQILASMDEHSKNWNFIKNHSHKHAIDDIINKGVTKNYSTRPFERMHGSLKQIYLRQTNFKDVAAQVNISLAQMICS